MTSLDFKSLDMELFRHNHARFVGLDIIHRIFGETKLQSKFNYKDFEATVKETWKASNPRLTNQLGMKMVTL